MKKALVSLIVLLLVFFITVPIVFTLYTPQRKRDDFFFGVTFGGNNPVDAERLIERVKDYTNLFVVDSYDVSINEPSLTSICDYAVHADLHVLPFFDFILYNVTSSIGGFYNASTWEQYGIRPFHVDWLNNARGRWSDRFLGVYYMDEPGGNQIDRGYWGGNNASRSGATIRTFENTTDYADAARRYVSGLNRTRSMQILTNTSYPNGLKEPMPVFTSDYALHWFDYKAGYSTVFAQINSSSSQDSKTQQIAMVRGAAAVQNKTWGVILTWASDSSPYLASGESMLVDMKMAYDAGAKYVIVFNFPLINEFGALTENHFSAMAEFWSYIQSNPKPANAEPEAVFVLPADYGWGMRHPADRIWGLWAADNQSTAVWNLLNSLVASHSLKLDIVYDDPQFTVSSKYSAVYYWNETVCNGVG